ncbi:MAG TPA: aldehyde dehydrogenase family protein, partial [Anaeromyxobacteraceae bacterium]|nr:aldehyde dehydrogenase family protein [Anaeromyxobacteraceae bacterium]
MGTEETAAVRETEPRRLEEAVARVRDAAAAWARAPIGERIALARVMLSGMDRNARGIVAASCRAKGYALDGPTSADEWLAVYIVVRILRQLAESLGELAATGSTAIGRFGEAVDGRLTERVFPTNLLDRAAFLRTTADVHYLPGVDRAQALAGRARFYRAGGHDGRVCAILGAGNFNAIPPADVAAKLFNEGMGCVLKMNPVNAYLGPFLEDAFREAVDRGVLAIVYGGAEVGERLTRHPAIDEVHITGSGETHDRILWGPPGPDREARRSSGRPLLAKEITSELGDVSPVLVVPGPWDDRTLAWQAESVGGMATVNASFNCIAIQTLVLARGWRLRERFLSLVERAMEATPARRPWYPGAAGRYRRLTQGRPALRRSQGAPPETLPWALVTGIDPASDDELFRKEAFCAVLGETSVGSDDPVEFLEEAVRFANERLPGTLSANVIVHPATLADPAVRASFERALRRLRYGTVAVNTWTGYGFGLGTTPWGGFPGRPLSDVRSGRGFVHNTRMLEGIEKTVLR